MRSSCPSGWRDRIQEHCLRVANTGARRGIARCEAVPATADSTACLMESVFGDYVGSSGSTGREGKGPAPQAVAIPYDHARLPPDGVGRRAACLHRNETDRTVGPWIPAWVPEGATDGGDGRVRFSASYLSTTSSKPQIKKIDTSRPQFASLGGMRGVGRRLNTDRPPQPTAGAYIRTTPGWPL
jgi:hypothetical protein